MGKMVFHVADFRTEQLAREGPGQFFLDGCTLPFVLQTIDDQRKAWPMQRSVSNLTPEIGAGVLIDGDNIEIGKADASFGEALPDRFFRKACPMLDTSEPFLFTSGHYGTIAHQAGR